ncbi:nucleotidyltransferase family protein [Leptospira sp. id769339]|uniref:nucleotidyltransferase family protein n=1 Tax=Leptospira sp. id769339 TaxID=2864221 RepID=UPI00214B2A42|nr:nucleotidyltransferase family protein [Leptospira sp. id769339]MCR1795700.1 nucleotidyltransferase family protein [Leptospira sp. id769339]
MNREQVLGNIRKNILTIQSYGIDSIGIFGSVARNENTPNSDLDVLVSFRDGQLNLDTYMDLKFYLESLFNCKVDLVTVSSIKPYFKEQILQEVVYAA